jgi:DnaD/phage-associated family protein
MPRSRNLKPGFFQNEYLAELNPLARLLYQGLWCLADRKGKLEDRPKKIKAEILPYDDCDIDRLLNSLVDSPDKFIVRYEVNGKKYIKLPNFLKHQNPHIKEPASIIPEPVINMSALCRNDTSMVQAADKNSSSPADSLLLIPDSLNLIPDSIIEGDEERAKEGEVFKFFNNNISPISPYQAETISKYLDDGMEAGLILEILKDGLGKREKWTWINKVLNNSLLAGIKTLLQYQAKKREQEEEKINKKQQQNKQQSKDEEFRQKQMASIERLRAQGVKFDDDQ